MVIGYLFVDLAAGVVEKNKWVDHYFGGSEYVEQEEPTIC